MFNNLKTWLIFKLIGDQPVIMNIDVSIKKNEHIIKKPLLVKNAILE